jgi:hypothetical protein
MNRKGKAQVAKLYANDVAVASYKKGIVADSGSIVVMEIYSPKNNTNGAPALASDGLYEIEALSAILVLEKRDDWDPEFPSEQRLGGWGFAGYDSEGKPKGNIGSCIGCHTPLDQQDYLFSQKKLMNHARSEDSSTQMVE